MLYAWFLLFLCISERSDILVRSSFFYLGQLPGGAFLLEIHHVAVQAALRHQLGRISLLLNSAIL